MFSLRCVLQHCDPIMFSAEMKCKMKELGETGSLSHCRSGKWGMKPSQSLSNLPEQISKAELEAMVWRAGRIIDVFIPIDKRSTSNRGFAFVRFASLWEAENAVELAEGRSGGGRKIQASIAHYSSNRRVKGDQERPSGAGKLTLSPLPHPEESQNGV